ncbi:MAG TPA: hypothetical protein VF808_18880 [Ktedonobacterales bacterium]
MRWQFLRAAPPLALAIILALGLAWAAPGVAPARAAGGCGATQSCIHWSSSMIYAGQNNGNPEGPVGEHASVSGEGFTADAGQTVSLSLVKGDVNNAGGSAYEFCKLSPTRVNGVAKGISVDTSGNFSAGFDWPAAAGSGDWSVCAINEVTHFPAGGGNIDDGPFYVMSSHAPSLTLSASTVNPGGSVTVTGRHWLPGQGQIFVYAGPCFDCGGAPLASAMVSSSGSGYFTVTLPIPATATPAQYLVAAHTQNSVLDTMGASPRLSVALAPTATPQPTATSQPSPVATAASGSGSSSGGGSSLGIPGWLLALLGVIGGLALAGLVAGVIILMRRRPPPTPPGGPTSYWSAPGPGAAQATSFPPGYTPAGPDEPTQVDLPPPGRL